MFAHVALRREVLNFPTLFLDLALCPEAEYSANELSKRIEAICERYNWGIDQGRLITACAAYINNIPCVFFELPEPENADEAFMVAIVYYSIDRTSKKLLDPRDIKIRYFTLEKAYSPGNRSKKLSKTVLGEWDGNTHISYGRGPSPNVNDFVLAISNILKSTGCRVYACSTHGSVLRSIT